MSSFYNFYISQGHYFAHKESFISMKKYILYKLSSWIIMKPGGNIFRSYGKPGWTRFHGSAALMGTFRFVPVFSLLKGRREKTSIILFYGSTTKSWRIPVRCRSKKLFRWIIIWYTKHLINSCTCSKEIVRSWNLRITNLTKYECRRDFAFRFKLLFLRITNWYDLQIRLWFRISLNS